MRRWFFEPMTEFEPKVGFETQFDVQCEGQNYPHQWKVTEIVPERRNRLRLAIRRIPRRLICHVGTVRNTRRDETKTYSQGT